MLDQLCRQYQSQFHHGHPEQARLVELHQSGQTSQFLEAYFAHEYHKGETVIERFAKIAPGAAAGRALDFGCGAGGLTYRIAQACREAVGIDLEAYKLEFAKNQAERLATHNASFVCYDGGTLPFPDASFDCIFCVDVIEHLPTPERFVAEFRRVLVPGGRLLLSFGPPWFHAHGKHMWAKLPGWWTHLIFPQSVVMRYSGFPPETTWEELGLHRLSASKFRQIIARSGLTPLHFEELINRRIRPLKYLPLARELFISEIVGVYRKPIDAETIA